MFGAFLLSKCLFIINMNPETNLPYSTPPKRGGVRLNVRGAGALVLAKDTRRFLFALRIVNRHTNPKLVWNLWSGPLSENENPETGVTRWTRQLTGYKGHFDDTILLYTFFSHQTNFRFYNYLLTVEKEFIPVLDKNLTADYRWVEYGDWPEPLYPTVKELLRKLHTIME